jgi:DnaJ-class molecular chaperone
VSSPGNAGEATGAGAAPEERPCAPCRGTGTVISNLGGERSEVRCPWCEGSGIQPPRDHDAQDNAPSAA